MVKHVLADGQRIESMDGFVIPSIGRSEAVYRIIKRVHAESKQQKRLYVESMDNQNELRAGAFGNG